MAIRRALDMAVPQVVTFGKDLQVVDYIPGEPKHRISAYPFCQQWTGFNGYNLHIWSLHDTTVFLFWRFCNRSPPQAALRRRASTSKRREETMSRTSAPPSRARWHILRQSKWSSGHPSHNESWLLTRPGILISGRLNAWLTNVSGFELINYTVMKLVLSYHTYFMTWSAIGCVSQLEVHSMGAHCTAGCSCDCGWSGWKFGMPITSSH